MKLCNTLFFQIERSKDHVVEAGILGAGGNKCHADARADQREDGLRMRHALNDAGCDPFSSISRVSLSCRYRAGGENMINGSPFSASGAGRRFAASGCARGSLAS